MGVVLYLLWLLADTSSSSGYVVRCKNGFKWDATGLSHDTNACISLVHGKFDDTINDRGFGSLKISTLKYPGSDDDYFYSMGYAEGILTATRIRQQLYNTVWSVEDHPGVDQFVADHHAYMHEQANAKMSDPYWIAVRFVLKKAIGLRDGMMAQNLSDPLLPERYRQRIPTDIDILKMQLNADIEDIKNHLDTSYKRPDAEGHCSALVQLTTDGQVIVGHATWSSYNEMLRIYKSFNFQHVRSPAIVNKRMSMSSYPGYLISTDDWITLPDRDLVILETTNECMAPKLLLENVSHKSVTTPYRSFAATLLSKDAIQWYQQFSRLNSGTQNNQWMIVNLRTSSLFVIEQMPGTMIAKDMTDLLHTNGKWASFNQCYFEETCEVSQYYQERSPLNKCEANREAIFHEKKVNSVAEMQTLLTTNDWLITPAAESCPRCVIASRFDIPGRNPNITCGESDRRAFGAIDAKVTSTRTISQDETLFTSGPPRGPGVHAFEWAASGLTDLHVGHPDRWDFGWYSVGDSNEVKVVDRGSPESEYVVLQQYV